MRSWYSQTLLVRPCAPAGERVHSVDPPDETTYVQSLGGGQEVLLLGSWGYPLHYPQLNPKLTRPALTHGMRHWPASNTYLPAMTLMKHY